MSFLLVSHLPRLIALERRTAVANRHCKDLYIGLNVKKLQYLLPYFEIYVLSVLNYVYKLIKTNMLMADQPKKIM